MTVAEFSFPKAFRVRFRDLRRFDPASFHGISWHWSKDVMFPIGSALKLRKEKVDRAEYEFSQLQPITIHFDGTIDKRKVEGRGYSMDLFFARPGDIVVAKIDLKNGAVGIVPDWENVVVTNHFAVYEPDRSKIIPEYFLLVIQANFFKSYLWRNKVGAEGRKEVKLEFFESIKIPMPSLDEQRRIVAAWQQAQDYKHRAVSNIEKLEEEIVVNALKSIGITLKPLNKRPKAFANRWINLFRWGVEFNQWEWNLDNLLMCQKFPTQPLSVVADVNPSIVRTIGAKDKVTFVPMAAVSDEHGTIETPQERFYSEVRNGYTCFNNDDVIWAKITPCMENGKSAVAKKLINGYGFGSTEFHVIRSKDPQVLMPEYIWILLRLSHIRQAATRYFIGSAGQQRVPADFLENLRIPVPPLEKQKEIVRRVEEGRNKIRQEQEAAAKVAEEAQREVERMILGLSKA